METLIRLDSSTLLRELLNKWSDAMAHRNAGKATYYAREIRTGLKVVLAHPAVLEEYRRRAGLPEGLTAEHVAVLVGGFFESATLAAFPQDATAAVVPTSGAPQAAGSGPKGSTSNR